eukprot:5166739-Amphidinium_carterae.1
MLAKHQGRGVQVCNGTNVRFFLPADIIDVTAESAATVLALLSKRLNGFRVAVIERARHRRGQVLAALTDDLLSLEPKSHKRNDYITNTRIRSRGVHKP